MKFALVFPGQGSQSAGMLRPFVESKGVREVFAEASDVLQRDLWKLIAEGLAIADPRSLEQALQVLKL